MKNKKWVLTGLIILIILVAIFLITIIAVGRNLDKQKANFKSTIEDAACKYAYDEGYNIELLENFNNLTKITFDKLIKENYLDKDLVNPTTKKTVNEEQGIVVFSFEGKELVCTYEG